jgi:hypothetical protein
MDTKDSTVELLGEDVEHFDYSEVLAASFQTVKSYELRTDSGD